MELLESRMFDMFIEELIKKIESITDHYWIEDERLKKDILNDILDVVKKTKIRQNEINRDRCRMMP